MFTVKLQWGSSFCCRLTFSRSVMERGCLDSSFIFLCASAISYLCVFCRKRKLQRTDISVICIKSCKQRAVSKVDRTAGINILWSPFHRYFPKVEWARHFPTVDSFSWTPSNAILHVRTFQSLSTLSNLKPRIAPNGLSQVLVHKIPISYLRCATFSCQSSWFYRVNSPLFTQTIDCPSSGSYDHNGLRA